MIPLIPEGSEIICPSCKNLIGTTLEPMYYGQLIKANLFKWAPNYEYTEGEICACKKCGEAWSKEFRGAAQIYTKYGWKGGNL